MQKYDEITVHLTDQNENAIRDEKSSLLKNFFFHFQFCAVFFLCCNLNNFFKINNCFIGIFLFDDNKKSD